MLLGETVFFLPFFNCTPIKILYVCTKYVILNQTIMKYYRIITCYFVILALFSLVSCINCVEPTGEVRSESQKLENFSKIEVGIPANIKIITGDSAKITISTCESYLMAITTKVRRGKLRLEGDICNASKGDVKIEITLPELSGINISGSADVFSDTPVRTNRLFLGISGSGKISLNVFANTIENLISGSGDIIINGTCQKLDVDINGSGDFKGLGLNSYRAKVSIKGSGNASIVALNKLNAKVSGSGEISYSGEPELSVDISGSGKINKIN